MGTGSTLEDRPRYIKTTCFETFPFPDEDTGLTPELRQRIAALAEQIDAHRKRVLSPGRGLPVTDFGGFMRAPASPAPASKVQAQNQSATQPAKGMTLTALYNVLEALREGRELTAKEKTINEQGLVGVLKDLHDELDAAVLAAYGWGDAPGTDELLTRLVALNAQRAAEEQQGRIRWLRPAFQNSEKSLSNQELPTHVQQALALDLAIENQSQIDSAKTFATAAQPWPAILPEQVRAVAQVLVSAAAALPLSALEARFKGKGPWKKGLPRILDTLEALGRARREGDGWRA